MSSRLLALLGVCTGLRVLPNILHSLPAAPSCAAVCLEDWELDSGRGVPTQSFAHGIGAWDNDEYLEMTKAATPEPADTKTLLRQAYAYRDMLKEKNLPKRPDVEEMIAELEAGADPETLSAVQQPLRLQRGQGVVRVADAALEEDGAEKGAR